MRLPKPNQGPFGSEERALSALIDRLVRAFDPEAIYLFGSRARGDATPLSDFDLHADHIVRGRWRGGRPRRGLCAGRRPRDPLRGHPLLAWGVRAREAYADGRVS